MDTIILKNNIKRNTIVAVLTIVCVVIADQCLKFWVKNNMPYDSEINLIGKWCNLHFIENNGMAFGLELDFKYGKLILTSFRIIAVIIGFYYLFVQIKNHSKLLFIFCISLIISGAIGNIIDSVFYGKWFAHINDYSGGYFYGRVVDMYYFPIFETTVPSWFPIWKGENFIFFSPIFNTADAAISVGVITILLFQKILFKHNTTELNEDENIPSAENTIEG